MFLCCLPILIPAASLTASESEWLVSGLAVVALLVGIAAGVKHLVSKRPSSMVISNAPLETRGVVEYVPMTRFEQFEKYVHEREHTMASQLQHLELATEERRTEAAEQQTEVVKLIGELSDKLDTKRSASVGNLHEQLKATDSRLSGVEGELRSLIRTVDSSGQKIDRILQTMPRTKA